VRVWLFNPYGPVPGEGWRDYRFTLLGRALAARGHEVVWWTSSFSHHFKRQRTTGWSDAPVEERFVIRFVPTPGYRSHVGPGRIVRDALFGLRGFRRGQGDEPPTLIVSAESPLAFGWAGPRLGDVLAVPYVVDVMDLWPELFDLVVPNRARPAVRRVLTPVYRDRARRWSRARAMTALCQRYGAAVQAVTGSARPSVGVFYNGIDVTAFRARADAPLPATLQLARRAPNVVSVIFAGTLGENYDVPTMLGAIHRLRREQVPLRLVIAGTGPLLDHVRAAAAEDPEGVVYIGKVGPESLPALYGAADIGLCAYGPDSNVGMPDKIYDYTAAGLAVVNSLPGELADLVSTERIGIPYAPGSADSLAQALRSLVEDPARRLAMAARSHAIAMRFDTGVQYGAFAQYLEDVAQGGK
jgi:glycosyltransferase involved in cell wall biosynthesis